MQPKFKKMLYGGDYNPNQWPKEIWDEDMKLFHQAGINSTTINVFSWAKIQPSENEYDFTELDEIVDTLTKEDVQIVMATSTGALPAWMVHRYPEVARTDFEGRHHKFGHRHNACPNSPVSRNMQNAWQKNWQSVTATTKTSSAGTSAMSTAASATARTVQKRSAYG